MNISGPFIRRLVATTLLTMPAIPTIYLAFDRIATRCRGRHAPDGTLADNPT
jgi:hypothetical protein